MTEMHLNLKESFEHLKNKRPIACPNIGFVMQLMGHEKKVFGYNSSLEALKLREKVDARVVYPTCEGRVSNQYSSPPNRRCLLKLKILTSILLVATKKVAAKKPAAKKIAKAVKKSCCAKCKACKCCGVKCCKA